MEQVKEADKKIYSNHKGELVKLRVRIDLETKGYTVFSSGHINQYGDFMVLPTRKIIKVKSARKNKDGSYTHGHLSHHNYDVLALVVGNTIIYQEINP